MTEQSQPSQVYTGGIALACSNIEMTRFDNLTSKCRYVFTAVNQTLILVKVTPGVACVHPFIDIQCTVQ